MDMLCLDIEVKRCLLVFVERHYNCPAPHQQLIPVSHNDPVDNNSSVRLPLCLQYHPPHPVVMLPGLPCVQSGAAAVLPQ